METFNRELKPIKKKKKNQRDILEFKTVSVIKKWMNLSGGFNCRPDTKEETGIRKQDDRSTECILTKANKKIMQNQNKV